MRRTLPITLAALALIGGAAGAAATERTYEQHDVATLRALDKINGRSTDLQVRVGEPFTFGSLEVTLEVCFQTPPDEPPESAAFLKVIEVDPIEAATPGARRDRGEDGALFSGWMFASSPGLSALEHPIYDIWVIRCRKPDPVAVAEVADEAEAAARAAEADAPLTDID